MYVKYHYRVSLRIFFFYSYLIRYYIAVAMREFEGMIMYGIFYCSVLGPSTYSNKIQYKNTFQKLKIILSLSKWLPKTTSHDARAVSKSEISKKNFFIRHLFRDDRYFVLRNVRANTEIHHFWDYLVSKVSHFMISQWFDYFHVKTAVTWN